MIQDITRELNAFRDAVYGEEVRSSMISALRKVQANAVSSVESNDRQNEDIKALTEAIGLLNGGVYKEGTIFDNLYISNGEIKQANTGANTYILAMSCQPATTYHVHKMLSNRFAIGWSNKLPAVGDVVAYAVDNAATELTITTGSDAKYLLIYYSYVNATISEDTTAIYNSITIRTKGFEEAVDELKHVLGITGRNVSKAGTVTTDFYIVDSQIKERVSTSPNTYILTIPCEPNTFYNVIKETSNRFMIACGTQLPAAGQTVLCVADNKANALQIKTNSNAAYLMIYYYYGASAAVARDIEGSIVIYKGENEIDKSNRLKGKKIACDGASIMIGHDESTNGGYIKSIAQRNNMVCINKAVRGATITSGTGASHKISDSITALPTDFDYYLFDGASNDLGRNVPFGVASDASNYSPTLDKTTFCGAFEYICKYLTETYPTAKIGYVFPHRKRVIPEWTEQYKPFIEACLQKWGIAYLDLEKAVPPFGLIPALKSTYTVDGDGTHPTRECYDEVYVPVVEAWLKAL